MEQGQAVGAAVEETLEVENTTQSNISKPVVTRDKKTGVVTVNDRKLVVRFRHYYPPSLFAVRNEPNLEGKMFDVIPFGFRIPSFAPNLNKSKHRTGNRNFIEDYESFRNAKVAFDFEHDLFVQKTLFFLKHSKEHQNKPAIFVTEANLYDYEEWVAHPPQFVTDPDTGVRVMIDEGSKPDVILTETAFCSISEKAYRKSVGRDKSLGRAIQSYIRTLV
jgi:hypothetical protein